MAPKKKEPEYTFKERAEFFHNYIKEQPGGITGLFKKVEKRIKQENKKLDDEDSIVIPAESTFGKKLNITNKKTNKKIYDDLNLLIFACEESGYPINALFSSKAVSEEEKNNKVFEEGRAFERALQKKEAPTPNIEKLTIPELDKLAQKISYYYYIIGACEDLHDHFKDPADAYYTLFYNATRLFPKEFKHGEEAKDLKNIDAIIEYIHSHFNYQNPNEYNQINIRNLLINNYLYMATNRLINICREEKKGKKEDSLNNTELQVHFSLKADSPENEESFFEHLKKINKKLGILCREDILDIIAKKPLDEVGEQSYKGSAALFTDILFAFSRKAIKTTSEMKHGDFNRLRVFLDKTAVTKQKITVIIDDDLLGLAEGMSTGLDRILDIITPRHAEEESASPQPITKKTEKQDKSNDVQDTESEEPQTFDFTKVAEKKNFINIEKLPDAGQEHTELVSALGESDPVELDPLVFTAPNPIQSLPSHPFTMLEDTRIGMNSIIQELCYTPLTVDEEIVSVLDKIKDTAKELYAESGKLSYFLDTYEGKQINPSTDSCYLADEDLSKCSYDYKFTTRIVGKLTTVMQHEHYVYLTLDDKDFWFECTRLGSKLRQARKNGVLVWFDYKAAVTRVRTNASIEIWLNEAGNISHIISPYSACYWYNDKGLLTKKDNPDGSTTEYSYDFKDLLLAIRKIKDPEDAGREWQFKYFSSSMEGNIYYLSQIIEPDGTSIIINKENSKPISELPGIEEDSKIFNRIISGQKIGSPEEYKEQFLKWHDRKLEKRISRLKKKGVITPEDHLNP